MYPFQHNHMQNTAYNGNGTKRAGGMPARNKKNYGDQYLFSTVVTARSRVNVASSELATQAMAPPKPF